MAESEANPYVAPQSAGVQDTRFAPSWLASSAVAWFLGVVNLLFAFPLFGIWALTFYYARRPPAPDSLMYVAHALLANFAVVVALMIYWFFVAWKNSQTARMAVFVLTIAMMLINSVGCFKFFVVGL